jgi:hypothetical protein
LKFSSDRSVWAPQYRSAGTWISPKASLSVRVAGDAMVALSWNRRLGVVMARGGGVAEGRRADGDGAARHVLICLAALGPATRPLLAAGSAARTTVRSMTSEGWACVGEETLRLPHSCWAVRCGFWTRAASK